MNGNVVYPQGYAQKAANMKANMEDEAKTLAPLWEAHGITFVGVKVMAVEGHPSMWPEYAPEVTGQFKLPSGQIIGLWELEKWPSLLDMIAKVS